MKKCLLAVLCIALCCTLTVGCKKKEKTTNKDGVKVVINKLKGADLDYSFTFNNNLLINVKNKDEVNLDVAFFDASNKLVRVENRHLFSENNGISKFYISGLEGEQDVVKRVEITPNKIKTTSRKYKHYEGNVKTTYTVDKKTNKMNLTINNDSGQKLDFVSYSIIFYKNKNIVDVLNYTNQNVEAKLNQDIFLPIDSLSKKEVKMIDYDEIKIAIDSAIKYEG